MRTSSLVLLATASLALALSGCGGGGTRPMADGGSMMPDDGAESMPETIDRSLGVGRTETNPLEIRPAGLVHDAALASPRAGSVTQGSAVLQGVTSDTVHLKFVPFEGGVHPIASIDTGDGRTLTSNGDPTRVEVHLPSGEIRHVDPDNWEPPAGVTSYFYFAQEVYDPEHEYHYSQELEDRWGEEGGGTSCAGATDCDALDQHLEQISLKGYLDHPDDVREIQLIHLIDSLGGGSFGENEDGTTRVIGNPSGMSVSGFTDYDSDETEYLAWGIWSHYRFTDTDIEWTVGAFADGVETAFVDVPNLGTASYSGYSSGQALRGAPPSRDNIDTGDDSIFEFVAEARLTADFAAASISGTVDNFRAIFVQDPSPALVDEALGDEGFLNGLQIKLGSADISSGGNDAKQSFFEGDVSASGHAGASGKWGGQFFGTPDAGEAPAAVGGTWGITEGDDADDWKMLGGFGAWKDDDSTAMTTDMAEAAARNAPNPGAGAQSSVTQSSNGSNGMTTDSVTTMVEYDNGEINFMVRNGSAWSISDDDTVLARPSGTASGVEFDGVELRKNLAGGTLWVDVYSDIEAPTTEVTTEQGEPVRLEDSFGSSISGLTLDEINARMGAGELDGVPGVFSCDRAGGGSCPAFFGTHFDPTGTDWIFTPTVSMTVSTIDADYLSLGLWVYVPDGATRVTDWEYGVFADGKDPFIDSNLRGITGSATYRGVATGTAVDPDELEEDYWTAEATLTAAFGTSSELGTVSGSVRKFDFESDFDGAGLSVTLGSAPIGSSNSGFFSGAAGFTYLGVTEHNAGQWGGRFFGNGEDDGKPGAVAGTFGVTSAGESLVGAFGAHKQ